MACDVFISHSVKDERVADAVVAKLEAESVTCWVAPRDVVPGADWGESIINAIESSRIMILIFSKSANESPQIEREVERAVNKGIYIIPFRVDNIEPTRSLEYFISTSQWMDAFSPPLERHLDNLAKTVKAVLTTPSLPKLVDMDTPVTPVGRTWPVAQRSVGKLILMAIVWILVFWLGALLLVGAIAGSLYAKDPRAAGAFAGESLSALSLLISLVLSIALTITGKLPGTRKPR
jgi:hypothetical protein